MVKDVPSHDELSFGKQNIFVIKSAFQKIGHGEGTSFTATLGFPLRWGIFSFGYASNHFHYSTKEEMIANENIIPQHERILA